MSASRHMRAKLTVTHGVVTSKIEEVQQVIKFVDGYPLPPEWEVVCVLTEDEIKELGISFVQEGGQQ